MNNRNLPLFLIAGALLIIILFGWPFLLVVGILMLLFRPGRSRLTAEQKNKLDDTQLTGLASLSAWLLFHTNNNSPEKLSTAAHSFAAHCQVYASGADPRKYTSIIIEKGANGNIDEVYQCSAVRNSFIYAESPFSSGDFLAALATIYENAVGVDKMLANERFLLAFQNIGTAIGVNQQIIQLILFRFAQKASHSSSWRESFERQYGGGYRGSYNQGGSYGYSSQSQVQQEYQAALKLLNVTDNVTKDELRRARRRLIQKWHPDKAPEGKQEEYIKKSQEINNAADLIAQTKGF